MNRYTKHLLLPEIGVSGQQKLARARVLIVGVGGLGCPAAMYLACAGVGKLGLVDFDCVDETNLQRQILYTTSDIGKPKLEVARERLLTMNPDVDITLYSTRLTAENALDLLKNYDVIIDGTDNFPTRYVVNDASVILKKTNVYGSVFQFEGQVSVFNALEGPCYRCLYPIPPLMEMIPNCAQAGVLGVLPGVIGTLQATEALKWIMGLGESLVGRLKLFDALKMKFREIKIVKDPDCMICSKKSNIKKLHQESEICLKGEAMISPKTLKTRLDQGDPLFLLDVREPHEYQLVHLQGSTLIPLKELGLRLQELNSDQEMVVYCHHGGRSQSAVDFLKEKGFKKVKNLEGGIDAWAAQIDPQLPRY